MNTHWIDDDICWCMSECDNTECFRHVTNKHPETKIFTAAYLKDTDVCPLKEKGENDGRKN